MPRAGWLWGVVVGLACASCFSEPEDACSTDNCGAASTSDEATTTAASMTTDAPTTMTAGNPSTTGEPPTSDTSGGADTSEPTTGTSTGDPSADGSSTAAPLCGNEVLDPGEECDGTDACTDCELDNFDCNPLNNAGCPEGAKCTFNDATQLFGCLPFSMEPPGGLHDYNCYKGGPQDQWCDVGLACMPGGITGACQDGGCCVEFCDIFDQAFECAQKGDDCLAWFAPDAPDGLDWLGVCATP